MYSSEAVLSKVPRFEMNRLAFYREEKDGFVSIRSQMHQKSSELVLNETSKDIMQFCDGSRDIRGVAGEMLKIYNGAPENLIINDIIKLLKELDKLKLIAWGNGDPFFSDNRIRLEGGYTAYLCSFEDLDKLYDYIRGLELNTEYIDRESISYFCPLINNGNFSKSYLYYSLIDDIEKYFVIEKEGFLKGIACLCINYYTSICDLRYIVGKVGYENLLDFMTYIVETIPLTANKSITGFRFYEKTADPINAQSMELFRELRFAPSGLLKDEIGYGGDLYQYDLILEQGN